MGDPALNVDITGDSKALQKAIKGATKEIHAFGQSLDTGISTGKIDAATDAIKKVGKVTKDVLVAGKDAAVAEQQFADALTNAGINASLSADEMDKAIRASQKLAFTDDETRASLTALAGATGSASESIALLSAAQDIARLAGVDLEQATDAVAKAYAGTDTALARMIPGLEQGATGMDTINNATKLAAGQADTYSKSAEALGKKGRHAFEELSEAVGGALLPVLSELGVALAPLIVSLLQLLQAILPALIPLIKAFAKAAEIAAKAITKIADAVTRLITKIRELLGPLKEAVNGLKNLDLNPFSKGATVSVAQSAPSVSTLQSGTQSLRGGSGGGVTINIYGDPSVIEARVVRALREYSRHNGSASIFTPERT
jgi:hypothetical protein